MTKNKNFKEDKNNYSFTVINREKDNYKNIIKNIDNNEIERNENFNDHNIRKMNSGGLKKYMINEELGLKNDKGNNDKKTKE